MCWGCFTYFLGQYVNENFCFLSGLILVTICSFSKFLLEKKAGAAHICKSGFFFTKQKRTGNVAVVKEVALCFILFSFCLIRVQSVSSKVKICNQGRIYFIL